MCGVAGYFSLKSSFNPETFSRANNVVKYRGPDDFGYVSFDRDFVATEHASEWLDDLVNPADVFGAFGFRRLAIIDLTQNGHQPMPDVSQRFWIVFNGEVYNYIELRLELEKLGYQFKSTSDTEVVLNAYIEWGPKCQDRFNGMWAFAIFDKSRRELFCSRDRFGIKPFYYYSSTNQFVFASEVKQVVMMADHPQEVDTHSVFDFLAFGARNHTSHTFHKEITELRGGECMTLSFSDRDRISTRKERWWDLQPSLYTGSEQEAENLFLELLTDSVKLRLRSDVLTGTALSGGLDSNGLVALIDQITGKKEQHVFTVYSTDKDTDELAFAKDSIRRFGLTSHTSEFGTHDVETLEKITFHSNQPIDNAGALSGWILQSLIKDTGITVNLSGQGADELMGGYSSPPHVEKYLDSLQQWHLLHAHKELFYGFKNSSMSLLNTSIRFGRELGRNFSSATAYKILLERHKSFMRKEFLSEHDKSSMLIQKLHEISQNKALNRRKQCSYRELKLTHLPYLLQNSDRDSMAHSLELRVPFLDYRLAEFLFSLPDNLMHKNGFTKHLLRKTLSGKISDDIVWNKTKKGFSTPKDRYLFTGADYFNELLDQNQNHPILNIDVLRNSLKTTKAVHNKVLWRSLCYLIWERQQSKGYIP